MNRNIQYALIVCAVIATGVFSYRQIVPASPVAPVPAPDVPAPAPSDYGFSKSIPPVFEGKADGKRDARRIAGQLDALADAIERDGERDAPQLAHVASVYDLWRTASVGLLDGRVEENRAFYAILNDVLDANCPESNAKLDKPARASVTSIFRAAAKACREAGGRVP